VELRELRTLVAVAEYGTLVQAAKALHQSPSTVSHAVTSLETKLGVRLFTRLPRGMVVTEAGEAMLGPARRALREAEAARAAATAVEGQLVGHIAIVSVRMTTVWLADLVAAFQEQHPLVVMSIRHPEFEEHIPDLIRRGEYELGVMRVSTIPPDLTATAVATSSSVVLAPAGHELAGRASIALRDLDGVAFISHTSRSNLAFYDLFHSAGVHPRVVAEASDPEMAFELVRAGVGVAIVAYENVAPVIERGTVAIPFAPLRRSTVAVVARRDAELGAAASTLLALAVDRSTAPDP
jgi:DNA-binding transcriptional LysR family regulator